MSRDGLGLDDVQRLLTMMSEHNVIDLSFAGLTVKRAPTADAKAPGQQKTIDEVLAGMPPDTVDRMLMLRRTRGGT